MSAPATGLVPRGLLARLFVIALDVQFLVIRESLAAGV